MSLNEFAGYRELSFMYDVVQIASSLKVSKTFIFHVCEFVSYNILLDVV